MPPKTNPRYATQRRSAPNQAFTRTAHPSNSPTMREPDDVWQIPKGQILNDPSKIMASITKETGVHIAYHSFTKTFQFRGNHPALGNARSLLQANLILDNPTFSHRSKTSKPSADVRYEAMGTFLWPEQEYPTQALGDSNFRKLDQIREDCWCTIDYDAARSCFVVKGSANEVQEAILRIRGVLRETVARSNSAKTIHLIQNTCHGVRLTNYAHPVVLLLGAQKKHGMGQTVKSIEAKQDPSYLVSNARKIRTSVMQTLNNIRWYRGNIAMRAHLGTLVLDRHRLSGRGCSLDDYKAMTDDASFHASVTEELGDKNLEAQLLRRFQAASSFLKPPSHFARALSDVKPEYMVSIVVDIQDGRGNLVIEKKWAEDDCGTFNPSPPEFYRLDQNSQRVKFLEVFVSDMVTDLTWQLDVSANGVQETARLPKWVLEHGEFYVEPKPEEARKLQPFVEFERNEHGQPRLVAHKKSLQQKIVWEFDMISPLADYTVEVAKVFNTEYAKSAVPGNESATSYEERWTVGVVHRDWASKLGENRRLRVGEAAEWQANVQTWFPVSSDKQDKLKGHIELLQALQCVQDIARGKV